MSKEPTHAPHASPNVAFANKGACQADSNTRLHLDCDYREGIVKRLQSVYEERQKLNMEAASVMLPEASTCFKTC